ncbi:hypothetical protein KC320_g5856 [Hortaea werneckii]|nr:hypothetical protein KC320_g5856 [Hortaea werneckii]
MSDKAETPDTTKGAIQTTRTGNPLLSPGGTPQEHPTDALNPQRAYGTAASQFWFELGFHVTEILVGGNKTYTLTHRASHKDLRALVQHPAIPHQGDAALRTPSRVAIPAHEFHFTVQTPFAPETLCGFDLRRAQLIPQRFPNLKSIVINLDICPGSEGQGFIMAETRRMQSATALLMQGVTNNALDAVARVDESCRREWELINGVLVKVVMHLRESLGEKVGRRHTYLTRSGGGVYRPPKELGRVVMGEVPVDPQAIADVLMNEDGQEWLIPF